MSIPKCVRLSVSCLYVCVCTRMCLRVSILCHHLWTDPWAGSLLSFTEISQWNEMHTKWAASPPTQQYLLWRRLKRPQRWGEGVHRHDSPVIAESGPREPAQTAIDWNGAGSDEWNGAAHRRNPVTYCNVPRHLRRSNFRTTLSLADKRAYFLNAVEWLTDWVNDWLSKWMGVWRACCYY